MRRTNRVFAVTLLAMLCTILTAWPAPAVDWKDRLDYLLAPDFRFNPGNYAAGVPDTIVYNPNKNLNLYTDIPAVNADGTVNAVIEIPAGRHDKWETDPSSGRLIWELKNGKPRIVKYLGYPGDYAMVPRTLGGDGDPLDIVLIGAWNLRGAVVAAKVIGVFHLIDGGDIDDKLIAVVPGQPLGEVKNLGELNTNYPGITRILELWFTNYKGPGGGLASGGWGDVDKANAILEAAVAAHQNRPTATRSAAP